MKDISRSRTLRRARYATVGIIVTAAAGTGVLTAAASTATTQNGDDSGTSGVGGTSGDDSTSPWDSGSSDGGGTGLAPAPSDGSPQGGSHAS